MRLKMRLPAGEHEVFATGAADNLPGTTARFQGHEVPILAAAVIEDGKAIEVTIDAPEGIDTDGGASPE